MIKLATTKFLATTTFVHYGIKRLNLRKFRKPKNISWNKPKNRTGLWASPLNSNHSWYHAALEMGIRNHTPDECVKFKLKRNARVLVIDDVSDLLNLVYFNPFGEGYSYMDAIDFEELTKTYDAIYLTEAGQWRTRLSHPHHLYGWDCECILILNKHVIKF